MKRRFVDISARAYGVLLRGYPLAYRRRFAGEMGQVFGLLCREAYTRRGSWGVVCLWLPVLRDWAAAVTYQWLVQLLGKRRNSMSDALDRQLGDLVWSISTGLRAGYNLKEVFQAMTAEAPEPAASACKRLLAELEQGKDYAAALAAWKQSVSSPRLARIIDVMAAHLQAGGNLADQLDPLGEELLREVGSDPAFYPAMRREAHQLGAKVPERAGE